jgi:hypothetical protein
VRIYQRRGARRWKKVRRVNGHGFVAKRFQTAYCEKCHDRIWGLGRQGYRCEACKMTVHKRCAYFLKPEEVCKGHPPVKGEEEKEGEGRVKKVRQTDEYNQHLRKAVRGDKRDRCPSHNFISASKKTSQSLVCSLLSLLASPSGAFLSSVLYLSVNCVQILYYFFKSSLCFFPVSLPLSRLPFTSHFSFLVSSVSSVSSVISREPTQSQSPESLWQISTSSR